MNVVIDQVKELVQREYRQAKKDHNPIASLHEGYALLLEESEETQEVCDQLKEYTELFWQNVRCDDPAYAEYNVKSILSVAIDTACEAIQVAAVCKRIMDYLSKEDNNDKA